MLTYARWKYFVLVLAIVLSTLYALPNLYQKDPSVQISASRGAPVDQALVERVATTLEQAEVPVKDIELAGDSVLVRLPSAEQQTRAADSLEPTGCPVLVPTACRSASTCRAACTS